MIPMAKFDKNNVPESVAIHTHGIFYMPDYHEDRLVMSDDPFVLAKADSSNLEGELTCSMENILRLLPCDETGIYLFNLSFHALKEKPDKKSMFSHYAAIGRFQYLCAKNGADEEQKKWLKFVKESGY
jgi:hypothetical protein